MIPRHDRGITGTAFRRKYGQDDPATIRELATLLPVEDYTNKYNVRVLMRDCGFGRAPMSHWWHTATTI